MSCVIKIVEIYDLTQVPDNEGYLNPAYTLNQAFRADTQAISGEKALKEYGISDSNIAFEVYPTRKQDICTNKDIYEKIAKFDGKYFDIVFTDYEGFKLAVKPKREKVVIVVD